MSGRLLPSVAATKRTAKARRREGIREEENAEVFLPLVFASFAPPRLRFLISQLWLNLSRSAGTHGWSVGRPVIGKRV